jgi:hypothetical protein
MKLIKRILKFLLKVLLGIILAIILIELLISFAAPVYDFHRPEPFSGSQWFNPYREMDSAWWRKANFHFHTRAWGGLTAGRDNSYEDFYRTYNIMFGYDAPQITNYQRIDHTFGDSAFFIPTYEHGFGVRKKHQMLIGARKVLWLDYSLYQNIHHKQHILNLLRDDNDIVALAHPDWENGYPTDEVRLLTNYDLMEVLDNNWRSEPQWDSALSAGRPVFILSDDDAHDISNPNQIHRCITYINSPKVDRKDLVYSLKRGNAFGAEIYQMDNETFERKVQLAKEIPVLNSVRIKGDTLWVSVSEKVFKFNFIGQGGKIRKITYLKDKAWYKLKPEDTYIRTEVIFIKKFRFPYVGQGTRFLLNPVFRYNGEFPENSLKAEINWPRTWIFRILGYGSLLGLGWFIFKFRQLRKIRKRHS